MATNPPIAQTPLMATWHPGNSLDPHLLTSQSNRRVSWLCELGHEWEATPNSRTSNSTGCPICSNRQVLTGYNDMATTHPHLASEWDTEANGGLLPTQVIAGGAKKRHWKCPQGHTWAATGDKRANLGQGCPYCASRRIWPGYNDLATLWPSVAAQWHPTLNGDVTPDQVMPRSSSKYWWTCPQGHEWQCTLSGRTAPKRPSGCPDCSKRVSNGEMELREHLESLLDRPAITSDRTLIAPYELDMVFPDFRLAVEFNGTFWHSDAQVRKTHGMGAREYHRMKNRMCADIGYRLLHVWQNDWENQRSRVEKALLDAIVDSERIPAILRKLEVKE